eukprot:4907944-Prymnesium_polylepis.1
MASRGPPSGLSLCTLRRMQLSGRRAVGSMHDHRLHAADRSASELLTQSAHTIRRCKAGGRLVAGGKPVNIVQNISDDLLDGGAELHYATGDA